VSALSEYAFGEFYRQHARALWVFAYRVTGNAADADDVVQEAFIRVFGAEVGALADEDLRRYLFRTANNVMADRWRRSARERTRLEEAGPPRVVADPDARDLDVTRTFAQLKPRERALLWLAYIEGEGHEQIADALRLKRGSVKVLLSRARARLRDLLKARGLEART
jgi:RNA polymerase sigma-70 factor (ECF subfamily)